MVEEVLDGSIICGGAVLEDGQEYTAYGIAVRSGNGKITIQDISSDAAFVRNLLDSLLNNDVAMCHVDDIVRDALCERSLPID